MKLCPSQNGKHFEEKESDWFYDMYVRIMGTIRTSAIKSWDVLNERICFAIYLD
jgi:hypothetical protein